MIVSTRHKAELDEVDEAVERIVRFTGKFDLLQCTSEYPNRAFART